MQNKSISQRLKIFNLEKENKEISNQLLTKEIDDLSVESSDSQESTKDIINVFQKRKTINIFDEKDKDAAKKVMFMDLTRRKKENLTSFEILRPQSQMVKLKHKFSNDLDLKPRGVPKNAILSARSMVEKPKLKKEIKGMKKSVRKIK